MRGDVFLIYRKRRRAAVLRKMAAMRAAKERKRMARGPVVEPPRMVRTTGLSWAVRDDLTGHVEWLPLKSVRDTTRRLAVLLRHYRPGFPV
jgi:hypothetical protein